MISLRKLLEADSKKSVGIEVPSAKQAHPNKDKAAITMTKDKKEPEKKEEPKPATMNKQQAGGGSSTTATTSDIQKKNGMSSLVAPVKHSAEKEANAMDAPEGLPPQNQYRLQPASSEIGKPATAQIISKIIPPQIDPNRFARTIIPGEQVQLCGPNDFAKYINEPQTSETVVERDVIVPKHEIESFLKAFHIGKNMTLPNSEFTAERTAKFPWEGSPDTVLVIIRLGANKEGELDVIEKNGHIIRTDEPEARCVGVSKLLCPRQSQQRLYCTYVIDLEERTDEDGSLPPIKEDQGRIETDAKIVNPIFNKYMNGPVRQPKQSTKLKDIISTDDKIV
jgi:hypothetical protein